MLESAMRFLARRRQQSALAVRARQRRSFNFSLGQRPRIPHARMVALKARFKIVQLKCDEYDLSRAFSAISADRNGSSYSRRNRRR